MANVHTSTVTLGERRTLTRGDEFTVTGEGRFRFHSHVVNAAAEWVDAYGPINTQYAKCRSFALTRIGTIHRSTKGRTPLATPTNHQETTIMPTRTAAKSGPRTDVTPIPKATSRKPKATPAAEAKRGREAGNRASAKARAARAAAEPRKAGARKPVPGGKKLDSGVLAPGALRATVAEYLATAPEPVSPSAIAKALERSAGAVRNACDSLVKAGEAVLVTEAPRRYRKAA